THAVTSGLTQALTGMAVAFSNSLVGIVSAVVLTVLGVVSNVTDRRDRSHGPDRDVPRPAAIAARAGEPGGRCVQRVGRPTRGRCRAVRRRAPAILDGHQGSARGPAGGLAQARGK